MPDAQEEAAVTITQPQETPELQPISPKQIEPELQKFMISSDWLAEDIFYFSGWRKIIRQVKETDSLGNERMKVIEDWIQDKTVAFCNDACAYYLYKTIHPLINAQVATSKVTAGEIADTWLARLDEISWTLRKNMVIEGNSFELKSYAPSSMISYLGQLYLHTKKAQDGYTGDKVYDSVNTTILRRAGLEFQQGLPMQAPRKLGIREKIAGLFGG